jgi:hypothetical protein
MSTVPCEEREVDVLLVDDPEVYKRERRPMIGRALRVPWWNLRTWLSRPIVPYMVTGDHDRDKARAGAWTPARFKGNRKLKANLVHAGALLVDVDEAGDVDRVAAAVARYQAIVHSTYKSTPAAPRCRLVLLLAEPLDADTYERTWRVVTAHLTARGFGVDPSGKDAGHLGFLPCVRPGAEYRFAVTDGVPIDGRAVIAVQSPPPSPAPRRPAPRLSDPKRADAYAHAALRRAAEAVATAGEGTRNDTLNKETYGIARLDGIDDETIEATMLDAALAAGLAELEARRTIASAISAGRCGA